MALVRISVLLLALNTSACDAQRGPTDDFPTEVVREALDAERDEAIANITRRYPGSQAIPGSLSRVHIEGSRSLEEFIFFTNLRSGRIDTVVIKYAPDLSLNARREILNSASPGLAGRLGPDDVLTLEGPIEGTALRVRAADRQGRLTLTVEAKARPR